MPATSGNAALGRLDRAGDPSAGGGAGQPPEAPRQLYLWFGPNADRSEVQSLVADLGGTDRPVAGGLAVIVPASKMAFLLDQLADRVSPWTAASVRFLVREPDAAGCHEASFPVEDVAAVRTLHDHCADNHMRLVEDLVRHGRLGVMFQPIFEAAGPGRLVGHEALLRIRQDDGALSSPAELFLKAARFGAGSALDAVARRAIFSVLTDIGYKGRIFINLCSPVLTGEDALLRLLRQLHSARIDPASIVLELTEWDGTTDWAALAGAVEQFRAAGFRIAVDDLGAGYSSLARLDTIRPDLVKIDLDLVRGVDGNGFKRGLLRSVVAVARSIGAEIVAEGVETAGELEIVTEFGVDYIQGHHLGRPAPRPWSVAGGTGPAGTP